MPSSMIGQREPTPIRRLLRSASLPAWRGRAHSRPPRRARAPQRARPPRDASKASAAAADPSPRCVAPAARQGMWQAPGPHWEATRCSAHAVEPAGAPRGSRSPDSPCASCSPRAGPRGTREKRAPKSPRPPIPRHGMGVSPRVCSAGRLLGLRHLGCILGASSTEDPHDVDEAGPSSFLKFART